MDYPSDTFVFKWEPGDHVVSCELTPVFPELKPLRTKMEYRVLFLILDGRSKRRSGNTILTTNAFHRAKPPTGASSAAPTLAKF